jgi:hypothetical protein
VLAVTTFWEVFWWMIIATFWILWIWMFITCFIDIFRRHDIHGFAKTMWAILLLIFPFFGCLIYLAARPAQADAV